MAFLEDCKLVMEIFQFLGLCTSRGCLSMMEYLCSLIRQAVLDTVDVALFEQSYLFPCLSHGGHICCGLLRNARCLWSIFAYVKRIMPPFHRSFNINTWVSCYSNLNFRQAFFVSKRIDENPSA